MQLSRWTDGLMTRSTVKSFIVAVVLLLPCVARAKFVQDPIVDYHIVYALALITFAVYYAGSTWGLGQIWSRLPLVQRHGWLR